VVLSYGGAALGVTGCSHGSVFPLRKEIIASKEEKPQIHFVLKLKLQLLWEEARVD
jgi:hypothetical protein